MERQDKKKPQKLIKLVGDDQEKIKTIHSVQA